MQAVRSCGAGKEFQNGGRISSRNLRFQVLQVSNNETYDLILDATFDFTRQTHMLRTSAAPYATT